MPREDDGDGPRGQLPPFIPPRFNWNQDNLYEQFKNFKRVVEFTFKGQYEKCSDSIKCGSILNWLGVEAYSIYDNLSINEDDKKDPSKLLDAFERYFKAEQNVFQSWYALGSIYSGAFKTQLEFYHKLNSVANDCNFTNKDEIVKFLYLTHNQNTRVCEHLLRELTDTASLADMLRMARVCEGTVHSEEISKQYLESVKMVKQVDAIHHQCNNNNNRSKSKGRGCGGHRSHSRSQSRKPGSCSNCGSSHQPRKCKAYGKECFHCHKKGHFSQLCHSRQRGNSCHDVHEIDQSQFDDSVQFKQDSITKQFKTQVRHSNIMFNEIPSTPLLQRVPTDVHIKAIGQSNWSKCRFKIDSGACGNLMPLSMFKSLYNRLPSSTSVNSAVCLLDYNKKEIKQLGTCYVSVRFRSIVKCVHFYVVPDKLKPIIGVSDALVLCLTSFYCPIYNDWQSNSDLNIDSVNSNSSSANHTGKVNSTFTLGTLTKQAIINHPKYAHLFSDFGHFKCKSVYITMKQSSMPVQKPPRRVPIAIKDKFKQELDSMEAQGIISKYDGHDISPEWLNSFVIVKKPNGSLCICLDPTDLNKEIIRPVCNAQTMDDVVYKYKMPNSLLYLIQVKDFFKFL